MCSTKTKEEMIKDLEEKTSALRELGLLELCADQTSAFIAANALQEMVFKLATKLNLSTEEVKEMQNSTLSEMKKKHEDRAVGVRESLKRRGMSELAIEEACANPYIAKNTVLLEFLTST